MSLYDSTTSFGNFLNSGIDDAWQYVDSYLNNVGLGDLSTWAKSTMTEYGSSLSDAQFTQLIRETPQYKTRFKAIEMAKANGQTPPTEAHVLELEQGYRDAAQRAGLPEGFYDSPDDFANLISRGVSVQEYDTRIVDMSTAVRNDPNVQAQMNTFYGAGLSEPDVVAYFLDPDKALTVLQRRQTAATLAARSTTTGFGQLNVNQAEKLAGQGVTDAQAQSGFAELAQQRSLLNPLASEQGNISTDTALAAKFDNNAAAQEELTKRRQERQAKFQGGGGYSATKSGKTGIGSSN